MAKKPSQIELIFTKEIIDALLVGVYQEDLLSRQCRMVFGHLTMEDREAIILGDSPIDKERRALFCAIQSPGDKLRALKKMGYDLAKGSGDKQKSKNPLWKITPSVKTEFERDPSIPAWVYEVFANETHCAMTGRLLGKLAQIDHKAPVWFTDGYVGIPKTKPANPAEADVIARHFFQVLHRDSNMKKREVCRACQRDQKRPGGFVQNGAKQKIVEWFTKGDTVFNKNLGVEACVGCGFYDCQDWSDQYHAR